MIKKKICCLLLILSFGHLAIAADMPSEESSNRVVQTFSLENATTPLIELNADGSPVQGGSPILEILEVQDMDIYEVLDLIAIKTGIKIDAPRSIDGRVTIYLQNVDVRDALRIILDVHGLAYKEENNVYKVMKADEFQRRYGYRFSENLQTRIVPLIHIEPSDLATFLNEMKSKDGRVTYNENTNSFLITDNPKKIAAMEDFIRVRDVKTATLTFKLDYVTPAEIVKTIEPLLTKGTGRITSDPKENSVTIIDSESNLEQITQHIEEMDHQGSQFVLDTKILQITLDDEHLNGVDWEAIVSKYKQIEFKTLPDEDDNAQHRTLRLGIVSGEDLPVLLDALDTVGLVNTTGDKQYRAAENAEMKIDVIYMEDSPDDKLDDNRVRQEDVVYYIKPEMAVEGDIALRVRPEFTFTDKLDFGHKLTAAESVGVPEGSTVIVGGLFKNIRAESLWKIPLLGDLPLLGFIFRNQYKHIRKTEIITILTPKIIDNGPTENK